MLSCCAFCIYGKLDRHTSSLPMAKIFQIPTLNVKQCHSNGDTHNTDYASAENPADVINAWVLVP